jgi:gluconate 2-dehydrogenase gamma chain
MTSDPAGASPALLFLNQAEAATIDALAARIVPGDADDPGAREAGSVYYIDRALAGFLRELQTFYRIGLRQLDEHCIALHGVRFVECEPARQDELVAELDRRSREAPDDALAHLFAVAREHIVQGFLSDPVYGGNRGGVGWRMVGFPGARWGYGAEHMARDFDARSLPLTTLSDLYAGDRTVA